MNDPLVSIVIPTKNRHRQLLAMLEAQSVIANLENIEIVIADNSLEPLPQVELNSLENIFPNIKYLHDSSEKDILKNFSVGLANASGEYLMFIGDDDFFLSEIVTAAEFAKKEDLGCIIYEPDRYYWKSCKFAENVIKYGPGSLIKSSVVSGVSIDVQAQLKKSAQNGFLTIEALPRAYHGIVKRQHLLAISDVNGALYGGSPDISMAINLALNNVTTYFWGAPLSIYGASAGSGGGMTTSKTHMLALKDVKFLSDDFLKTWNNQVPTYWSEYTVFPASAIYIHQKRSKPVEDFNLAAVYASILVNENSMWGSVVSAFSRLDFSDKCSCLLAFPMAITRKSAGALYRKFVLRTSLGRPDLVYINDLDPKDVLRQYNVVNK